jgi:STE24 endopeptidase
MNSLTIAFVLALGAGTLLQIWLALRHSRYVQRHARAVPAAFSAQVSADSHARAADYTRAKLRVEMVGLLVAPAVLLMWTLGGGLEALDTALSRTIPVGLWQGIMLIGSVLLVSAVLELPLEAWRVFGIEARFGFNHTTVRRFVTDRLLGTALAVLLGGPLLLTVLWLMGSAGSRWWLAVWLVWMMFTLGVTWAFPRFIAPLFNRFNALEAGTLRDRLTALLARCGFSADGIFVMDGSRRSAHGNAYFTGLGRHKRIVFFDTLMNQLEESELEAVLAHELGHYRRHHIHKSLALMALSSFLGLALLGWLADQNWFYTAFGVSRPGDAMALLLFLLVVPVFMVFVQPLFGALSRRHEFEADAFAAEHADAGALVSGLVKLYRENASPLVSDPLYAAFHYSHPPPEERVARLQGTS